MKDNKAANMTPRKELENKVHIEMYFAMAATIITVVSAPLGIARTISMEASPLEGILGLACILWLIVFGFLITNRGDA